MARRIKLVMLIYRMPNQPNSARVAVWRLLKKLGAVYPQQSVCVVPDSVPIRRELQLILSRIEDAGGEYHLLPVGPLTEEEEHKLIALFLDQSAKHYQEIIEDCEVNFTKEIEFEIFRQNFTYEEAEEIRSEYEKIVRWFQRVRRRDWFGAPNRAEAEQWLQRCADLLEDFEARVYEQHAARSSEEMLLDTEHPGARPRLLAAE